MLPFLFTGRPFDTDKSASGPPTDGAHSVSDSQAVATNMFKHIKDRTKSQVLYAIHSLIAPIKEEPFASR